MKRLSLAVVLSFGMLCLLAVGVVQAAYIATFVTSWGSAGAGDGQFNGAASGNPVGVAVGLGNDVYVVDTYNYRIQQFHADGTFVRAWGSGGAANSQFNQPYGVATDAAGHVYVTDIGNGRVQVFSADGSFVRAFSVAGFPAGIAVGPDGNVYVTELNGDQVKVFTPEGSAVTAWGSTGTDDGKFNNPIGIAVDSTGQVYVAEQEGNRIQLFDSSHAFVRKWGSFGTGDGQFNFPKDVEVDTGGRVYVVDDGNHRVQIFNSSGDVVGKWGSYGTGNGQFDMPMGIAVDGLKRVFVSDGRNHRIEVFQVGQTGGDTTAPAITVTTPKNYAVLPLGTALSFSAQDEAEGSGLATGSPEGHLTDGPTTTTVVSGYKPGVGVYTLVVNAADRAGNTAQTDPLSFVIYDPAAGFVTGGGWIDSPAGSYTPNSTLAGRANFGFVSKYQKGATTPVGQTEFQFEVAGFNFHSDSYQWLVVAGPKAQYKGTGTVNGIGGYGFLLTATDGQASGGGGVDKFRIKIWKSSDSTVVYDNVVGSPDDVDSAKPQAIGGGSIVIHAR